MKSLNRVFITGMSALTSSGLTSDENWKALLEGRSGIDEIKEYDLGNWSHRLGGELKNFQAAKMLPDRKLLKVISRQDAFGINAAMQAVEHSNMLSYRETLDSASDFNDGTAVYVGSPGNKYFQQYDFLPLLAKTGNHMEPFAKQLFDVVHPMWLLRILPNNVLAYTGITYGFKGPNHNITNHAVGGMQAIIEAYHAIQSGQAQRAVVVAYDAGTEPQALYYYGKLGVISEQHLRPFDATHDGTILAEGAAALVLESETSAKARSATCYAEVCGGVTATENAGLFSIDEDGASLAYILEKALRNKEIKSSEVGCVVSHGNGNKKSDVSESAAISKVFNNENVPVTAFKWSMGHTLCASGIVDTVLATYALREKIVPGIANLSKKAESCDVLNIKAEHRTLEDNKSYTLIINRGFASINTALVIKSCE